MHSKRLSKSCVKIALGAVLFSISFLSAVTAQTPPSASAPTDLPSTPEQIQAKIALLSADKELKDDVRAPALEFYNAALKALTQAQADTKLAADFRDLIDNGAARVQAVRQAVDQSSAPTASELANLSVKELQQRLASQIASNRTLNGDIGELDRQIKALQENPAALAAEMSAARAEQDRVKQQTLVTTMAGSPQLAVAERTARQAQQLAAAARVRMLELKQSSRTARLDLLTAQREHVNRRLADGKTISRAINAKLNAKQRESAQRVLDEAQRAVNEPQVVRGVAEQNVKFSKELASIIDQTEQTITKLRALNTELQEVSQTFEITKEELAIDGVGVEQAEALRRDRRKLPTAEQCRREEAAVRHQMNQARVGQLRCNQENQNLEDLERRAAQIVAEQADKSLSDDQRAAIQMRVKGLLNDREQLVDNLGDAYNRYIDLLTTLEQRRQQLASKSTAFAQLLDERLMWIPSASPISPAWLGKITLSIHWLTNPSGWQAAGVAFVSGAMSDPAWALGALGMVAALLILRPWLFRKLSALGRNARGRDSGEFKVTGFALLISVLIVLPGPMLCWALSNILLQSRETTEFVRNVAAGLYRVSVLWFYLESLRQLCRADGLADAHFQWNSTIRESLRSNLTWLLMVYLPLIFVIATTHANTLNANASGEYAGGLGRFAFVLMSMALSIFLWSVLHQHKGVLGAFLTERKGWGWRTRIIWYPAAVATPLLLGVAALLGYYYAALAVEARLLRSVLMVIAMMLLHNLLTRWLVLLQSKIRQWVAREQHAAEDIAKAGKKSAEAAGIATPQMFDMPHVDVAEINEQTRTLFAALLWVAIGIGLWVTWVDLLPALRILDSVTLWQHTVIDGTVSRIENVTLGNLIVAVLLATLTVVATRNVAGVLEIILLPRLSLDAGARYAINRITSYAVIAAGTMATLNAVGIGWAQVQWLAAGFSVGLGFGMQEIFANFISGLIMLFERPVRVGDIVTVDDKSGTVSRIRMRATTITDWDNKEIIVPNKKFITDRVINWTLSNQVTRAVMKVSVSLDSDAKLAEKLMLEVARAHPEVLQQPSPTVFLTQFGESALNFELRVFVKSPVDQMPVLNDLHLAIEAAFRKHSVRIP